MCVLIFCSRRLSFMPVDDTASNPGNCFDDDLENASDLTFAYVATCMNDMLSLTLTGKICVLMPMLVQNRLKNMYCLAFCVAQQSTWLAETNWALDTSRNGVQAV
ncbi:TPA: hypothetical protein ACH3X1_003185 [Trebouxia sp. C0004]